MSAVLTLAVHAHVPWRRGTVAEAAPRLQRGPSRGGQGVGSQDPARASLCPWHMRARHVRVCALPVPASHSCIQAGLSVHTHAHTSVHQTQHHAHTSHTHTPSCTHVRHTHAITYTCTLACKRHHGNTPHHVHTHARAHCHVCILQVVALGGGPDTPLSREEDPPRTAGHCRTTPHAHSSCYQHPIQKTVLIRKSANGSLQLLIASLIWDFFQGGTE